MYRKFIITSALLLCLVSTPILAQSTQDKENLDGFSKCTRNVQPSGEPSKHHYIPQRLPAPASAAQRHACPNAGEWWPKFLEELDKEPASQPQTWTILFYDDADFHNAYDPFVDFVNDAHSDVNVNVLVLQDTNTMSGFLWYVYESHATLRIGRWGEVDMGDYATLRDFIAYGKANYPADRYLLALYDHGGGWAGACTDVTNGGWLLMDDIRRALDETGGVVVGKVFGHVADDFGGDVLLVFEHQHNDPVAVQFRRPSRGHETVFQKVPLGC